MFTLIVNLLCSTEFINITKNVLNNIGTLNVHELF